MTQNTTSRPAGGDPDDDYDDYDDWDCGGVVDGFGQVHSDADPGL